MRKIKQKALYETNCDATNVPLADCIAYEQLDKGENLGCILEINGSYGAIADGFYGDTELHLSREVTEKVLRFLLNEYPKTKENELIQHCLSE